MLKNCNHVGADFFLHHLGKKKVACYKFIQAVAHLKFYIKVLFQKSFVEVNPFV